MKTLFLSLIAVGMLMSACNHSNQTAGNATTGNAADLPKMKFEKESFDFGKLRTIKAKSIKRENNTIPGHVQASINWNKLRLQNDDRYSMEIQDGQKTIVCKLKANNNLMMSSIAYPIDEMHLPEWFRQLPFDERAMEDSIIDKKIGNLLGVLNWNFAKSKEDTVFSDLFSFGSDK